MSDKTTLFTRQEIEDYAEVLLWAVNESRNKPLKNGDMVLIRFDHNGLALCEALYSLLTDKHLRPVPLMRPTPIMEVEKYLNSSFAQLTFQPPGFEELYARAAAGINILAPEALNHLQAADPLVMAEARKAEAPLKAILERRKNAGTLGWTTCVYPTKALADAAGIELEEYATQLKRACWLNMPSPLKEWKRIAKRQQVIIEWLQSLEIRSLRVESANIDLKVKLGDNRRFVGFTGHNVPGSEIYVAPDCRAVEGVFFANQPSVRSGHLVHGATLEFNDGITTRVTALMGETFLQRELYADAGARKVGEFSLTDKRLSRVDTFMAHTLLDENFAGEYGNCHIALGGSLIECFDGPPEALTPELETALGFNSSNIHWDLVNTEPKRVIASTSTGEPVLIYENGEFRI